MDYDVIVVGAGPGGASAAFFLGQNGQRVLILERARLPRYKPCGGGVLQATFRRFPFSFEAVIEARPTQAELHYPGSPPLKISLDDRPIAMVRRPDFDAYILAQASSKKVDVLEGVSVTGAIEHPDGVQVNTSDGRSFVARYLVGADGANSTVARALGLRKRRVLGGTLEAEVEPEPATLARWAQTIMLQFGACPGGYLWIFPKRERLSVGIARFKPGKVDLRGILVKEMANFGPVARPSAAISLQVGAAAHCPLLVGGRRGRPGGPSVWRGHPPRCAERRDRSPVHRPGGRDRIHTPGAAKHRQRSTLGQRRGACVVRLSPSQLAVGDLQSPPEASHDRCRTRTTELQNICVAVALASLGVTGALSVFPP